MSDGYRAMEAVTVEPEPGTDLRTREARERLARLVTQLFVHWKLSSTEQAALLGLSPENRSTLSRYRKAEPLADMPTLLHRTGHLPRAHKPPPILRPAARDPRSLWITIPHRTPSARPVDIVSEDGLEGLLALRRYLDFERGT